MAGGSLVRPKQLAARALKAAHLLPAVKRVVRRQRKRRLYATFIRRGDLCFDVGANVGDRVAVFLGLGARVIAVEPQRACADVLRAKFSDDDNCTVVEKAVGSAPGTARLMLNDANYLATVSADWVNTMRRSGRFGSADWGESVEVDLTTLDDLIERFGIPVFCKIDVEGYEREVLDGLSTPIAALSFEFTIPEYVENAYACLARIADLGSYEFNYSVAETMHLVLPEWVSADVLSTTISRRSDRMFGDIYARLI